MAKMSDDCGGERVAVRRSLEVNSLLTVPIMLTELVSLGWNKFHLVLGIWICEWWSWWRRNNRSDYTEYGVAMSVMSATFPCRIHFPKPFQWVSKTILSVFFFLFGIFDFGCWLYFSKIFNHSKFTHKICTKTYRTGEIRRSKQPVYDMIILNIKDWQATLYAMISIRILDLIGRVH